MNKLNIKKSVIIIVIILFFGALTVLEAKGKTRLGGIVTDLKGKIQNGVRIYAWRISKNETKYRKHITLKSSEEKHMEWFLQPVKLIPQITRESYSDKYGKWNINYLSRGDWQIIGFKGEYMTRPALIQVKDKKTFYLPLKLEITSIKFLMDTKRIIYKKDYSRAIDQLKWFIIYFPKSRNMENSLYWLSYSIKKYTQLLNDKIRIQKMQIDALNYLNRLITKFKDGEWNDDARILRIEFASKLAGSGSMNFFKYIVDEAENSSGLDMNIKIIAINSLYDHDRVKAGNLISESFTQTDDIGLMEKMIIVLSKKDPELAKKLINRQKSKIDNKDII